MKYWFGLGYPYLSRLFYCFTVFYVTLRYIVVSYWFTLRLFYGFLSCQPVQLNMKFRVGLRRAGFEIRVQNLDMSTCAVKYEILVLNMEFRVGLRYPSLTGFGIRNSVGLKFGFEI